MTNGHKIENWEQDPDHGLSQNLGQKLECQNLAQNLDPEQVDGWSQHVEQKLVMASSQLANCGSQIRQEVPTKPRLESTRQRAEHWCRQGLPQHEGTDVSGKLMLEHRARQLAVDVCLCPRTQKANQRPSCLEKQRGEGLCWLSNP